MPYQGAITVQPGKTFKTEGGRKVALCKRGPTAWNSSQTCDYAGRAMRVVVKRTSESGLIIIFEGSFDGSSQWQNGFYRWFLEVTNDTDQPSDMYVHVE